MTHGSSVGRFGSHCNRVVAMENQHALREHAAAKRNAFALNFGDPKENKHAEWKRRTTQFAGNFSLGQMSCKSFLKSQVGIISLGTFQVFCEARATRAHDPLDSRLLGSIASTAARRLTCLSQ